jgi:hypothetical protein
LTEKRKKKEVDMPKRKKQYLTLREKILQDYGVGKVVTPRMLWKRYGRKHSKDYIGSVLATGERSRKNSPCKYVFTWRVGEGRYKIVKPAVRRNWKKWR